jgi:hypothetical protein
LGLLSRLLVAQLGQHRRRSPPTLSGKCHQKAYFAPTNKKYVLP